MKILKYLKGSKSTVFLILIFLIVQAICELSLPSYTSEIVDIGIQQKGISESIPEKISFETMENLQIFMSDDEILKVRNLYSTENGTVYKLDHTKIQNKDIVNKIFQDAILCLSEYQTTSNINDLKKSLMSGLVTKEQIIDSKIKISSMYDEVGEKLIRQKTAFFLQNEYETIGVDINGMQMDYLINRGTKMIIITIIMVVAAVFVSLVSSRVSAKVGTELREGLFRKVLSFSNEEVDKFSIASLITRSTNDIQQIQQVLVLILRIILYAPIMAVGGVVKVIETTDNMGWIIGVAVLVILVIVGFLFKIAMPKFKIMQTLVDKLNLVSREILTGIQVIRAFSREDYEEKRFDVANKELTRTQLFTNKVMNFMMPTMMLVMNVITIMIVWFGAKGIDVGNLQVGDMMAFITYTMQIVMSFMMITMTSIMLPRANVASTRIEEVMSVSPSITDKVDVLDDKIENWNGCVKFDDVCFKYSNAEEYSLKDISFTANPGQTTAIIGGTGSGKSTLVHLILRFYDVTKGNVTIDNVNVKDMSQEKLRGMIGFVPQKNVLFSGSIMENIKFGGDTISDESMLEAADIAQAKEFIEQKSEKYLREISQGGKNVSGGQKQRLAIARALAKRPKILIFDDSFSALDYKTDFLLRKALKDNVEDTTVIIVAQRISTILNADKIIVLNDGKIDGIGMHKELLKNCDTYQEIAKSQLSDEELNDM